MRETAWWKKFWNYQVRNINLGPVEEFYECLEVLLFLSPLLFFIVAITFRLLDNSGLLFLQKEILIDSSYESVAILREQMQKLQI